MYHQQTKKAGILSLVMLALPNKVESAVPFEGSRPGTGPFRGNRCVNALFLLEGAAEITATVALVQKPAAVAAREAVNRAGETSLREGVFFERHFSHGLFTGRTQSEGVGARLERPLPSFSLGWASTEWSQDHPGSTQCCGRVTGTVRRTSRSLLWSRW